jgi:hypothetical protein
VRTANGTTDVNGDAMPDISDFGKFKLENMISKFRTMDDFGFHVRTWKIQDLERYNDKP